MVSDERARTWAAIVYPDSAPSDWVERLRALHIPAAISPLHDADVWTAADEAENPEHKAGELKKPHWHLVLYYAGKKGSKQVLDDLRDAGVCVSRVERVRDVRAYNRYLCHMDDPDKAAYDTSDVRLLSGAAFDTSRGEAAKADALRRLTAMVRDEGFTEYADLVFWAMDNDPEAFSVVVGRTIYFRGLIASERAKLIANGGEV